MRKSTSSPEQKKKENVQWSPTTEVRYFKTEKPVEEFGLGPNRDSPENPAQKRVDTILARGVEIIHEMRADVRSMYSTRLAELYATTREAEVSHEYDEDVQESFEGRLRTFETYVNQTLSGILESEHEMNMQYWAKTIPLLTDKLEQKSELEQCANKAFEINAQIKQSRAGRATWYTGKIAEIVKKASIFQNDSSQKGKKILENQMGKLKKINRQLEAELAVCLRMDRTETPTKGLLETESLRKKVREHIEKLVNLERDPSQKETTRESYELPLENLFTDEELTSYVEMLEKMIRENPREKVKEYLEILDALEPDEVEKVAARRRREAILDSVPTEQGVFFYIETLKDAISEKRARSYIDRLVGMEPDESKKEVVRERYEQQWYASSTVDARIECVEKLKKEMVSRMRQPANRRGSTLGSSSPLPPAANDASPPQSPEKPQARRVLKFR